MFGGVNACTKIFRRVLLTWCVMHGMTSASKHSKMCMW